MPGSPFRQSVLRRHGVTSVAAVTMAACLAAGCTRREPSTASAGESDPTGLDTPLVVARALRAWHHDRRYLALERYVVPEQRVLLVDSLMAFNRLLGANERAQRLITAMHNERVAAEFSLSRLANTMGLFSQDVEFRGERIDGDHAVVTAQVAGTVPLEEFDFVRRGDRWIYAPESPLASLPDLVHKVADGVERFIAQLEGRQLTVNQIRSEFRHRVSNRLRAIQSALQAVTSRPASRPATSPTTQSK
jgi:hypothetical protein